MKSIPIQGLPSNSLSGSVMTPGLPSLCKTFRELERWTWNKIDSANKNGVSFGEETITESLLLEMAERHKGQLDIRAFTKREEGTGTKATGYKPTGADYSLWIADSNGLGVEIRFQAKRQFHNGKYRNLDGFGQQIVDLWNNRGKSIPLYVFYNGPFKYHKNGAQWSNFSCGHQCEKHFVGQDCWGCSFAGVHGIPAKAAPYPSEITDMNPWHCLVCNCQNFGGAGLSLPQKFCAIANLLYGVKSRSLTPSFPRVASSFIPHDNPPTWVSMLGSEAAENEKWEKFWSETDLKGVAVIRELSNKSNGR